MSRRAVVVPIVGVCLACGGGLSAPEPVAAPSAPPAVEAPKVETPAAEAPKAETPKDDAMVCCREFDQYNWMTASACSEYNGELTPDWHRCGLRDATERILTAITDVEECGYSHRRDGKLLVTESVSTRQAIVAFDGGQRRLPLVETVTSYPPPSEDEYTYEGDGLRVDILRDEKAETAKVNVIRGQTLEFFETRTTFLPCGD